MSSTTLNAVTENGEFKSYVRAADNRRTSGEIEINKRQHMEGKIVLAVTDSRANYLVIDGSVSPIDFVDKVKEVLYEYRYVDAIYRDMVTMDVVRANLGRLYTKEDSTNEEDTFAYVAIIRCMDRKFELHKLATPKKLKEFGEIILFKFDVLAPDECDDLMNNTIESFDISPEPFIDEHDGWMPMTSRRPEDFEHLIEDIPYSPNDYDPLIKMTKKVLVYDSRYDKYYLDARRKFQRRRIWIWHQLEGYEEIDKDIYWREIPYFE